MKPLSQLACLLRIFLSRHPIERNHVLINNHSCYETRLTEEDHENAKKQTPRTRITVSLSENIWPLLLSEAFNRPSNTNSGTHVCFVHVLYDCTWLAPSKRLRPLRCCGPPVHQTSKRMFIMIGCVPSDILAYIILHSNIYQDDYIITVPMTLLIIWI